MVPAMEPPQILICILALISCGLSLVESNSMFYLKLDEFENYEGVLSSHQKCDSGRPCDPAFSFKVRGVWGEIANQSDCYVDKNHIQFGSRIGTALSNPLSYPESAVHFPVSLDIRVKDCMLGSPDEDIADFYEELNDLPRPYLFTDAVDPERDTERVKKLDLQSLSPAPISIKLRVTVWHQCTRYYYGSDCTKFCKTVLPGYECSRDGVPTCTSAECQPQSSTTSSTESTTSSTQSTTSSTESTTSSTQSKTSSTESTTSSTQSTASTIITSTSTAETIPVTAPRASTTAIKRWTSPLAVESSAAGVSTRVTSATTTTYAGAASSSAAPSGASITPHSASVSVAMVVVFAASLIAMLLAVISVLLVIKLRRSHRPPPVTVSSVRFNRDKIGHEVTLTLEQNFPNPAAYATTMNTDGASGGARPYSEVYEEEPVDPVEQDLPPLPARDQQASSGHFRSFVPGAK